MLVTAKILMGWVILGIIFMMLFSLMNFLGWRSGSLFGGGNSQVAGIIALGGFLMFFLSFVVVPGLLLGMGIEYMSLPSDEKESAESEPTEI
jgi:hypothetical protein